MEQMEMAALIECIAFRKNIEEEISSYMKIRWDTIDPYDLSLPKLNVVYNRYKYDPDLPGDAFR